MLYGILVWLLGVNYLCSFLFEAKGHAINYIIIVSFNVFDKDSLLRILRII
jgi:hypothetical protein